MCSILEPKFILFSIIAFKKAVILERVYGDLEFSYSQISGTTSFTQN